MFKAGLSTGSPASISNRSRIWSCVIVASDNRFFSVSRKCGYRSLSRSATNPSPRASPFVGSNSSSRCSWADRTSEKLRSARRAATALGSRTWWFSSR